MAIGLERQAWVWGHTMSSTMGSFWAPGRQCVGCWSVEAAVVVSTPDVWRTLIQIEQQAWGFTQDPRFLKINEEASHRKSGPYSPQFRHPFHWRWPPVSAGWYSPLLCLPCHHELHLHKTWAFTDITTNFFGFPILTEYQQLSWNPPGFQHPTGIAETFSLWAGPATTHPQHDSIVGTPRLYPTSQSNKFLLNAYIHSLTLFL